MTRITEERGRTEVTTQEVAQEAAHQREAAAEGEVAAAAAGGAPNGDDSGSDDESQEGPGHAQGNSGERARGRPEDPYKDFPAGRQAGRRGGTWAQLDKERREKGTPPGYELHHFNCKKACDNAGREDLKKNGPAGWVLKEDHYKTASSAAGKPAAVREAFIAKQEGLI
jgi:hypothetical protein